MTDLAHLIEKISKMAGIRLKRKVGHVSARYVQLVLITSFYRTFGCPIIYIETYSQCYFGH